MIPSSQGLHLFLLIGQSNMAGRGQLEPEDQVSHPRVWAFTKNHEWIPAIEPIHFDRPAFVGVGPGLSFGKTLADYNTSIHIGLIPCAVGGSPITMWKPGKYFAHTESYPYDDAVTRTRIAMKYGILKGILWHQGESDSDGDNACLYEQRLIELIISLRVDLDIADIPFLVGTLSMAYAEQNPYAITINKSLKRILGIVKNTACVDTNGLAVSEDKIHFTTPALRELGRRYAETMITLYS